MKNIQNVFFHILAQNKAMKRLGSLSSLNCANKLPQVLCVGIYETKQPVKKNFFILANI